MLKWGEEYARQRRDILIFPECLLLMLVEEFWKGKDATVEEVISHRRSDVSTTQVCEGRE